jgi:hypothetical protein
MSDLATRSDPQLVLDLLLHALRVRDNRLNAVAAEILTRHGVRPVPELVRVAGCVKNPPGYRVRALEVLARIGPPYGLELLNLLDLLRRTRCKAVREAAERLFIPFAVTTRAGRSDDQG